MTDITPLVPAGRQIIQSYGDGGFQVSGESYSGPVLIFPDRIQAWPARSVDALGEADFADIIKASDGDVLVLLLGCGTRSEILEPALRNYLHQHSVVVEVMDTGAACRTYNVLVMEDRKVAAGLLPVS